MIDYTVIGPNGSEDRSGRAADLRADATADHGGFIWVDLDSPEPETLRLALDALGLDRFGADPERAIHRRPKVETAGDAAMVLIKTVWYIEATRQVETGDLAIYTDERSLVTVRRGLVDPVPAVRDRLDEESFRAEGAVAVVHALFASVVEQYDSAVEDLADDVADIERAVFSGDRIDRNQEIYFLIREALEFRNAVQPLVPFARLVRQRRAASPVFQREHFGPVAGRLIRVDAAIETCMNLLTTVLTAHQGQIGTWQNDAMKKISAWAAIAVVPTAIAGIYGMNFRDMPELHWKFGYPLVLLLIVVICSLLHRGFRRNGWLLHIDVHDSQRERARGGTAFDPAPLALPAFNEHHIVAAQIESVEPLVTLRARDRAPISTDCATNRQH
ncbi:magnesium and cobalt transport protein CorA [Glycomyces sp. NRRL B-16210]|uniref:magnesium and cobalt transport protein CorA n=1 Tax=Glycomyces sp. NRRL B-16210 TaxID=1463821 RepID=UPI00068C9D00|nr:magnesium and cobalt transport protein CorA [Glycomyces sp. NRRL B-16210]